MTILPFTPAIQEADSPAQTRKPSAFTRIFGMAVLTGLAVVVGAGCQAASASKPGGPAKVEVRQAGGKYQLCVNGVPFYIKGAGLEFGNQEQLAAHGANSFRTWRVENGRESGAAVLDRALRNGLMVTMGIEVTAERHGFDYNDPAAVARQLARIKAEVLKHKDHPALLMWAIGNELNLNARNPAVWNAVNEISKMIHAVDPNHPTLTTLAGINRNLIQDIQQRAPDLDLIGIQMYADIVNLPRYLKETGWTGPYVVTEWGATGHWEVPKTAWGAPLENDSTVKAEMYHKRFEAVIRSDTAQCVGSYVFLWGQKQERTPTWYGMFLESGEETATVDVMHYLWNGKWPANRSPALSSATLDGRTARDSIRLQPGRGYTAKVVARDEDNDRLAYSWVVMEESKATSTGGDFEATPQSFKGLLQSPTQRETQFTAPAKPGAYRLFVYVYDGKGHAAHANIPFHVDGGQPTPPANP